MVAQPTSAPNLITRDGRGPLEAQAGNIVQTIIEQTFGVLGRHRRLLVDQEGSTTMARTMTLLAGLFMTGNRFERQIRA